MRSPARCAPVVAAALASAVVLAGCTSTGDALGSGPTDLARAERAWADPWLAPVTVGVPTDVYGANGLLDRTVGSRTRTYAVGPRAAVRLEAEAAAATGWRVVAASCGPRRTTAQLARGEGLDDAVLATVSAAVARRGGATTTVDAVVPHHADGSWPVGDPPGATCLDADGDAATAAPGEPVTLPETPTTGDGATEGPTDVGWRRDSPDADATALLAAVADDPWAASVGVDLRYPTLRTGDNDRTVEPAAGSVPGDVADVVAGMTAWEPVHVACGAGAVDVRLRLVTAHGTAVARLRQDAATGARTAWEVAVGVPEGPRPDPDVPALSAPACLDRAAGTGGTADLVVEGTPVVAASSLHPIGD